jgi:hypothetical protein
MAKLRGATSKESEDSKAPLKAVRNAIDHFVFHGCASSPRATAAKSLCFSQNRLGVHAPCRDAPAPALWCASACPASINPSAPLWCAQHPPRHGQPWHALCSARGADSAEVGALLALYGALEEACQARMAPGSAQEERDVAAQVEDALRYRMTRLVRAGGARRTASSASPRAVRSHARAPWLVCGAQARPVGEALHAGFAAMHFRKCGSAGPE